uniref:Putative ATPase domain containing protein n=1 Tax=viral metagenome TaxID=1070528 RepID=A0A6M3KBK0_9ZZZZ
MPIHDVSEYITWRLPPQPFYIQDILPQQGTMLVYGDPKVKKSWLVQHMAYCVGIGDEWLGFRTTQARVLINQFEVSPYAYHNRLYLMARHYTLPSQMIYENTHPIVYLEDEETYNRWSAEIRAAEIAPNVIIMDCMSACFGGDENNGEQMAIFIAKMVRLKTEYNASLILVHHANKNTLNPSSVSRARGHSRLTGWVDTLVYLCEQPTGIQLQIKARQSTREIPPINISFEDYNWRLR